MLLSTCPACKHPFGAPTEEGTCPHCGEPVEEVVHVASAVIAEGGEDAQEPTGRRVRRHKGPAPSLQDGIPRTEDPKAPKLAAFFATFVDVVFRPRAFFGHLSLAGARGITWFAYVCLLAALLWDAAANFIVTPAFNLLLDVMRSSRAALMTPNLETLAKTDPAAAQTLEQVQQITTAITEMEAQLALAPTLFVVSLIAAPLVAFFAIHLVSGLVHLTMRLLNIGGEPIPYEQTYRFTVYATAPLALGIVPGVAFVSKIWFLVVLVIAMRRLHRIKALGVIAGILLPVIFLAQVGVGTIHAVASAVHQWRTPAVTTPADVNAKPSDAPKDAPQDAPSSPIAPPAAPVDEASAAQ